MAIIIRAGVSTFGVWIGDCMALKAGVDGLLRLHKDTRYFNNALHLSTPVQNLGRLHVILYYSHISK
jgi:hypothetical protein